MGAWIETFNYTNKKRARLVAPRVGAWIETFCTLLTSLPVMSHPVWVRGLKRIATEYELKPHCVAPRVGAWIET